MGSGGGEPQFKNGEVKPQMITFDSVVWLAGDPLRMTSSYTCIRRAESLHGGRSGGEVSVSDEDASPLHDDGSLDGESGLGDV